MKETARILKFKGKEMRSAPAITAAQEALMADLLAGEITVAESRQIQKELNQRISAIASALKTAGQLHALNKMAAKLEQLETSVKNRQRRR